MPQNRPTTDQVRFTSVHTGEQILDSYIEACERGGRAVFDLLADLFKADGSFETSNFQFRIDSDTGNMEVRVGQYIDPEEGWATVENGKIIKNKGTWAQSTSYLLNDLVTHNNILYICTTAHTSTTVFNPSNFQTIVDVDPFLDSIATTANNHKLTCQAWSSQTGSTIVDVDTSVDSNEYSAKEYASGTTVATGSAKQWATKLGSPVEGSDYSAKYYATSGNVSTVATNITNINTVATNIADVNTVAPNITAITNVNSNSANINTVATNLSGTNTIGTVATSITNVNSVGGSITAVNAVYANEANINTVASDLTGGNSIGTVGSAIANVNTVATNILNVNTVANNNTNVTTCATNIAAIQDAPAQATAAANSATLAQLWAAQAEDVIVSGGQYSAYHWAQKAEDTVNSLTKLVYVSSDDTTADTIENKFLAGIGFDAVINNPGGNETFTLRCLPSAQSLASPADTQSVTLDLSQGHYRKIAPVGGSGTITVTLAPITGKAGQYLVEIQDGGLYNWTWDGAIEWADGGTVPSLSTSGIDIIGIFVRPDGTAVGWLCGRDFQ